MYALRDDLSGFARAIVRGHDLPQEVQAIYPHYPVATALDIYRNNYRGNLHDTLSGAYAVCEQIVGKDFFRQLTREYIEQHPSYSGNLHLYGAGMATFIAAFAPAQELAYLADVVSLEWACHCAYHAQDAATLDVSNLAQISPTHYSDLILLIHPACHVLRSRYPIAAIWHAHQPGAASDFHIDLDKGGSNVLVNRRHDEVSVDPVGEADAHWLLALMAGSRLGAATSATLECYPDFDLRAALLNLATQGVLTDFKHNPTPKEMP